MSPVAIFDKDSETILYILTFLRVFLRIPAVNKGFERHQMPGIPVSRKKASALEPPAFSAILQTVA